MYQSKLESKELDNLFKGILKLKTVEECYMFFEDLCTVSELEAFELRFKVAKLLMQKNTCQKIADLTGASTATISRVNRCINYGTGGYLKAIGTKEKGE